MSLQTMGVKTASYYGGPQLEDAMSVKTASSYAGPQLEDALGII